MPRSLYLVCGRRIGRVGATDRLRPWSTKIEKTAKKSNGRRAFLFEKRESPNSCLGPFVIDTRGARICKDGPNERAEGGSSIGPQDDG